MSNIRSERFTTAWLSDPEIFSVNEQPVNSDHEFFASQQEMNAGVSSLVRSLDGKWKAHFAMNPAGAPDALLTGSIMDGSLKEIFASGTAAVISPIGWLNIKGEDYQVADGKVGPVAQKLYDNIYGMQTGVVEDDMGWIERV